MKHRPSRLFFVVVLTVGFLTSLTHAQTDATHAAFDKLLKQYVRNGLVTYVPLRDEALPQLNSYLDQIAKLDIAALSKNDQLAAYINIYNATMLKAVCDRYMPGYSPSNDNFKVFSEKLVRLKTGTISLNDLENTVIRPTFKDPRIHVALVCGAVSCPPLIDTAYTGKTLDMVLDAKFKDWLVNDPTRNKINQDRRTIYLSKIFDWYADDFGGKDNILKFVDQHHPAKLKSYAVKYLDYDWSLNIRK
tara:strand:+ start:945 stop:1685 length:741 start_codon:yes stop_codon:yes gene_type:complete